MDDKVVEEIRMHEETIATDSNTPLHMIREKELEISGRMLAAKREADEIVADARKRAVEIVAAAESHGGAGAADRDAAIRAQAEKDAEQLRADAQAEAQSVEEQVRAKQEDAVRLVVENVVSV